MLILNINFNIFNNFFREISQLSIKIETRKSDKCKNCTFRNRDPKISRNAKIVLFEIEKIFSRNAKIVLPEIEKIFSRNAIPNSHIYLIYPLVFILLSIVIILSPNPNFFLYNWI